MANSKKERVVSPVMVSRVVLAMAQAGVPMRVMMPPMPAAKAKGMRILERLTPVAAEMPMTTGSSTAMVPVLDSTEERVAVTVMMMTMSWRSVLALPAQNLPMR